MSVAEVPVTEMAEAYPDRLNRPNKFIPWNGTCPVECGKLLHGGLFYWDQTDRRGRSVNSVDLTPMPWLWYLKSSWFWFDKKLPRGLQPFCVLWHPFQSRITEKGVWVC